MNKLRAVGWRDVGVWGFLGLLPLAGALTITSSCGCYSIWALMGNNDFHSSNSHRGEISVTSISPKR